MNGRSERLMSRLPDIDCVMIVNGQDPYVDPSFRYFADNMSGLFEHCIMKVSSDGSTDVLVSIMEETSARKGRGTVHTYQTLAERDTAMRELFQDCRRVGVNSPSVTLRAVDGFRRMFPEAEIVDVSGAISMTRSIKDAEEVSRIRKACSITSRVAEEIPGYLGDRLTEQELSDILDRRMKELGGQGNAFQTIAAFGEGCAEPHHRPEGRVLRDGDPVLCDFGCTYEGYCSDLTRTVFRAFADEKMARAYSTVLKAQEAGLEAITGGARAMDVDAVARKIIDSSEFKGKFIHSFGHEIGMTVHEGGSISKRSPLVLEAGMVVSAEPGVYLQGEGGIRIEDTVLVLEDGNELLTCFDKELLIS